MSINVFDVSTTSDLLSIDMVLLRIASEADGDISIESLRVFNAVETVTKLRKNNPNNLYLYT
jgi:hypothetical protein